MLEYPGGELEPTEAAGGSVPRSTPRPEGRLKCRCLRGGDLSALPGKREPERKVTDLRPLAQSTTLATGAKEVAHGATALQLFRMKWLERTKTGIAHACSSTCKGEPRHGVTCENRMVRSAEFEVSTDTGGGGEHQRAYEI